MLFAVTFPQHTLATKQQMKKPRKYVGTCEIFVPKAGLFSSQFIEDLKRIVAISALNALLK
jgi:hypothetical protein